MTDTKPEQPELNGPPPEEPGTVEGERVLAALAVRPLTFSLIGNTPPEAEQSAHIPEGTGIYQATVADGLLNAIAYLGAGGLWVLEVAHVLDGLLAADGNNKAGRPPHIWELRAARARFIPGGAIMGFLILPPEIPMPRPPNCIMLSQIGEARKSGLVMV